MPRKKIEPVRIPAGPRCLRCGHSACPCCVVDDTGWCDVVRRGELCCAGLCTYASAEELKAWNAAVEPLLQDGGPFVLVDVVMEATA